MTIRVLTQQEILARYLAAAQARANILGEDIDVTQFTDFQIKGSAISGIVAGVSEDARIQYNNVFPQYSDAQGINLGLANSAMPAIFPATPAILAMVGDSIVAGKTYLIPVGTILTAPNGATYSVISTNSNQIEVTVTSISNLFYVVSTATGLNTTQPDTTQLTFSPPIISTDNTETLSTGTVSSSVDGVNQETLANATNRLIEVKQIPLCGTRSTDFKKLALDPANNVTDAIVLIKNQVGYAAPENVGIFDVSGTPITNEVLNQGLFAGTTEVVFSRTSSPASIANTQTLMDQQDIIGAFPNVSTVSTQEITPLTGSDAFFNIKVTLQPGYSLSTQITLDGNVFTLYQLIQREVRRAICAQPYGAVLSYDLASAAYTSSVLNISSIEQQLDATLGTPTTAGTLGSYLISRAVYIWNGSAYVYQPTITLSLGTPTALSDELPWIYDISTTVGNIYSNILVEVI